ncbi:hypothetical protein BU25DRAFT_450590 [Macroventuria anomochaeta]|uniref:Uncharacterized protein n=1 Tax=Macroventuria anomochaeta TaxID=301207 RepID=A0ACB6RUD5_9PLEO|nr:uncharacterized protein BU25DRAFT_450590 [Macroventuria anomochaeta]KAF2624502.1 hypothetical protein BU25DRAFT_450590 [Macroventuria anomochaeta]
MCGGDFAASATLAKIWYMRDISRLTNVTYAWAQISLCYLAELFILIITGSLPTLRPIMRICCSEGSSKYARFAALKKGNNQSSSTSPYDGTTMAGTLGWELPEIENSQRKDSLEDLTALPPFHARPEVRIAPSNSSGRLLVWRIKLRPETLSQFNKTSVGRTSDLQETPCFWRA